METTKNITVIPARRRVGNTAKETEIPKLRVAAYCRVSTDSDEQATSYEAQVEHYTDYIRKNPEWEFAGIFADDGISGTNTKKREEFNRMIDEAMAGKIDMIVTKSISRFARNTLDCLKYIRQLKEKNIPVLLLHLPKMSWTYAQSEALEGFAAAQGVTYLDLDKAEYREQLGLDPKVDYYDQGHMNLTGTIKLSRWLGAWLDAQYALPDHREDAAISAEWNADFKEYAEKTGLQE